MTLKDAYRNTPTNAREAADMLAKIREHVRHGLQTPREDRCMDLTPTRMAYLQGFLDGR